MKKFLLIITSCLLLVSAHASTENQIFDAHRMEPVELMYEAYQQSRVLLIGTSNHSNFQHYNRVMELLELVGDDPNLKYIVMERSHEVSGFYELLSTKEFDAISGIKGNSFTASSLTKKINVIILMGG